MSVAKKGEALGHLVFSVVPCLQGPRSPPRKGLAEGATVLLEKVCSQDQGSGGPGTEPGRLFETKLGTCGHLAGWPWGEGTALH